MEPDKWLVLLKPVNLLFVLTGLWLTIKMALVSIVLSLAIGTLIAVLRLSGFVPIRWLALMYTESMRNLPLLLLVFFSYFAMPKLGINLSIYWAAVVAFTVFTSALVAEIVRGGIQSVPRGQVEAAISSGMTYLQTMQYVILPQAMKKMIPPLISQFVTLVKDTSYAMIIGASELFEHGKLIYIQYNNPLQTLFFVAVVYFVVNYSLSLYGRYLERRLATD